VPRGGLSKCSATELVEEEGGETPLARERFARRRRTLTVRRRIELQREGEEQARDFEDAALTPARRLGSRAGRPAARQPAPPARRQ